MRRKLLRVGSVIVVSWLAIAVLLPMLDLLVKASPDSDYCLSFDGNDYVQVEDAASLNFSTGDFTFSYWFKTNSTNWCYILNKLNEEWEPYMYTWIDTDDVGADIGYQVDVSGVYNDDVWHQLLFLRESGVFKVYVNGNFGDSTEYASSWDTNEPLTIGVNLYDFMYNYTGYFDEFRVYNRTISQTEINYGFKNKQTVLNQSGLVLWFDFNAGTDGTVTDKSGNGNTGTIHGAVYNEFSYPFHTNTRIEHTYANINSIFTVLWHENDYFLDWCGFTWNGTGSWSSNQTLFNDAGVILKWGNITKTLPSNGTRVGFRWYCNNTNSIMIDTGIKTITTSDMITANATHYYIGTNKLEISVMISNSPAGRYQGGFNSFKIKDDDNELNYPPEQKWGIFVPEYTTRDEDDLERHVHYPSAGTVSVSQYNVTTLRVEWSYVALPMNITWFYTFYPTKEYVKIYIIKKVLEKIKYENHQWCHMVSDVFDDSDTKSGITDYQGNIVNTQNVSEATSPFTFITDGSGDYFPFQFAEATTPSPDIVFGTICTNVTGDYYGFSITKPHNIGEGRWEFQWHLDYDGYGMPRLDAGLERTYTLYVMAKYGDRSDVKTISQQLFTELGSVNRPVRNSAWSDVTWGGTRDGTGNDRNWGILAQNGWIGSGHKKIIPYPQSEMNNNPLGFDIFKDSTSYFPSIGANGMPHGYNEASNYEEGWLNHTIEDVWHKTTFRLYNSTPFGKRTLYIYGETSDYTVIINNIALGSDVHGGANSSRYTALQITPNLYRITYDDPLLGDLLFSIEAVEDCSLTYTSGVFTITPSHTDYEYHIIVIEDISISGTDVKVWSDTGDLVSDVSFSQDQLEFTVTALGTSITEIYCGLRGMPTRVWLGNHWNHHPLPSLKAFNKHPRSTWYYNPTSQTALLKLEHSSDEDVKLDWNRYVPPPHDDDKPPNELPDKPSGPFLNLLNDFLQFLLNHPFPLVRPLLVVMLVVFVGVIAIYRRR